MLAITRRPSPTTFGSRSKRPSSSTSCDTALVADVAVSIAIPMSARFSAGMSLTPSPVIATVCPAACNASTRARFCSGSTRPNTVVSSTIPELAGIGAAVRFGARHRAHVDGVVGAGMPEPLSDRSDGVRTVARDHLHRDVLASEVLHDLGGVGSHLLGEATTARGVTAPEGRSCACRAWGDRYDCGWRR